MAAHLPLRHKQRHADLHASLKPLRVLACLREAACHACKFNVAIRNGACPTSRRRDTSDPPPQPVHLKRLLITPWHPT